MHIKETNLFFVLLNHKVPNNAERSGHLTVLLTSITKCSILIIWTMSSMSFFPGEAFSISSASSNATSYVSEYYFSLLIFMTK